MNELVQTYFTGPMLPASALLTLILLYWLLTMLSGAGLDFLDFDLDFDADFDTDSVFEHLLSAGAVSLNFLNIGKLPLNLWLSVYAVAYWVISAIWDHPDYHTNWDVAALVVLRNGAVALIPTKLLTQPLRGRFEPVEPDRAEDLIGSHGEVTTAEVTPKMGQARFRAGGAPLLLNVRTAQSVIAKGERVEIVAYDAETSIFTVEKISSKPT